MSMGMNRRAIRERGGLECDEEALKAGAALEGNVDALKGEGVPLKSKVKLQRTTECR